MLLGIGRGFFEPKRQWDLRTEKNQSVFLIYLLHIFCWEINMVFDPIPGTTGKQNYALPKFTTKRPFSSTSSIWIRCCDDFLSECWFWTYLLRLVQRQFLAPVQNFQQNQMGNHFGTHLIAAEVHSPACNSCFEHLCGFRVNVYSSLTVDLVEEM